MNLIQQSITSKVITLLVVLANDSKTGATGKTLTVTRSKNGAAFGAWAGSAAELANGWYALTPAAGDVDTLGELAIHVTAADSDPADVKYTVVGFDPYVANLAANLTQWLGVAPLALTTQKVNSTLGADRDAKIDSIGTSAAYAVSPTIAANTVRIVRGDDFSATDGRAIDLVYSGQPDFTSATSVTMKIVSSSKAVSTTLATWTGSVVNATTLRFTPTDTETALLPAINSQTQITYPFEVSLTLASGSVITPTSLHAGKLLVDAQAT